MSTTVMEKLEKHETSFPLQKDSILHICEQCLSRALTAITYHFKVILTVSRIAMSDFYKRSFAKANRIFLFGGIFKFKNALSFIIIFIYCVEDMTFSLHFLSVVYQTY